MGRREPVRPRRGVGHRHGGVGVDPSGIDDIEVGEFVEQARPRPLLGDDLDRMVVDDLDHLDAGDPERTCPSLPKRPFRRRGSTSSAENAFSPVEGHVLRAAQNASGPVRRSRHSVASDGTRGSDTLSAPHRGPHKMLPTEKRRVIVSWSHADRATARRSDRTKTELFLALRPRRSEGQGPGTRQRCRSAVVMVRVCVTVSASLSTR